MSGISFILLFVFNIANGQSIPGKTCWKDDSKSLVIRSAIDTFHLYFPLKESGQDSLAILESLDTISNIWYSKILFAFNEPVLADYSGDADIIRFTWLRSFHNPIIIRLQKEAGKVSLTVKVSNGTGGFEPGQIVKDTTFDADFERWNSFQTQLVKINFWKLPVESDFRGSDGAEWILESSTKEKYHFITRWSPGTNSKYREACLYLLGLSGINLPEEDKY